MRLAIWMLRGKTSALLLGLFAGHRATVPNGQGRTSGEGTLLLLTANQKRLRDPHVTGAVRARRRRESRWCPRARGWTPPSCGNSGRSPARGEVKDGQDSVLVDGLHSLEIEPEVRQNTKTDR